MKTKERRPHRPFHGWILKQTFGFAAVHITSLISIRKSSPMMNQNCPFPLKWEPCNNACQVSNEEVRGKALTPHNCHSDRKGPPSQGLRCSSGSFWLLSGSSRLGPLLRSGRDLNIRQGNLTKQTRPPIILLASPLKVGSASKHNIIIINTHTHVYIYIYILYTCICNHQKQTGSTSSAPPAPRASFARSGTLTRRAWPTWPGPSRCWASKALEPSGQRRCFGQKPVLGSQFGGCRQPTWKRPR